MSIFSQAQFDCPSLVDITVTPNQNNQLEIWLRPHNAFDGYFSSLVFTLKWMNGEANLGAISQELIPYFTLGTSGPEQVDGIYRYQIYAGFGGAGPLGEAAAWDAGEEILLTRIDVVICASGQQRSQPSPAWPPAKLPAFWEGYG